MPAPFVGSRRALRLALTSRRAVVAWAKACRIGCLGVRDVLYRVARNTRRASNGWRADRWSGWMNMLRSAARREAPNNLPWVVNAPKSSQEAARPRHLEPALARRLSAGLALIALLVLSCGVWAATTPIAGAVIASGTVVVENNTKKVQHPSGGVVSDIPVKNGDRVSGGDVVLRLDDTQARANLGIVVSQLIQLVGRKARLEAERDQIDSIRFPAEFLALGEEAQAIAEGERRLFEFRRASKRGQVAQLTERIGQIREEIKGLAAQREAKNGEVDLMVEELDRLEVLRKKDLMATNRILAAQRDLTRLKGEWGALVAQTARAKGQISEMELQILSLDQTMQTEATKELREMEARLAELAERRVAAEDQLKRVVLRAPQTGIVHDLAVHTVGGVIGAGETEILIVPYQEELGIDGPGPIQE